MLTIRICNTNVYTAIRNEVWIIVEICTWRSFWKYFLYLSLYKTPGARSEAEFSPLAKPMHGTCSGGPLTTFKMVAYPQFYILSMFPYFKIYTHSQQNHSKSRRRILQRVPQSTIQGYDQIWKIFGNVEISPFSEDLFFFRITIFQYDFSQN